MSETSPGSDILFSERLGQHCPTLKAQVDCHQFGWTKARPCTCAKMRQPRFEFSTTPVTASIVFGLEEEQLGFIGFI